MPPIFHRAETLGVPMLILTGAERLVDLVPLLEQHPELDVVIDHMAGCSPDAPEKLELLLNLARFPRVYVKISHTWSISKTGYPWADTFEQVKKVYHAFGGFATYVGNGLARLSQASRLFRSLVGRPR